MYDLIYLFLEKLSLGKPLDENNLDSISLQSHFVKIKKESHRHIPKIV